MKVAFVVLHYLAIKDTIECIESILNNIKTQKHQIDIVVVDNGSPNQSYDVLKNKFTEIENLYVLKNESNLGFAKGNNVGYKYAKYNLKSDYIVLINNDTLFFQIDFVDKLVEKYDEKKYFVLGPDIVSANGYHQNPGNKQSWSLKELSIYRIKKRIRLLLSYLHLDNFVSAMVESDKEIYRRETLVGDVENTILHGACLIFSPLYVKRFEGLYDETFLYMEEDILKLHADFYGFMMLYSDSLRVYHKEDVATNMVLSSLNAKVRLKYQRLILSSKIYSKLKRNMIIKKIIVSILESVVVKIKSGREYKIDLDMPFGYLIKMVFHRCCMVLRGIFRKIGMKKSGRTVFIGKHVSLKCKARISMGSGATIHDYVVLDALSRNGIHIGNGASIGRYSVVRCSGNFHELGNGFYLGENSSIADNCFIGATGGVFIGKNVIGGQNIRFHSSNHKFNDKEILIKEQGITAKGIVIGDNCWIGAGVVFCDGVTIGSGCVIGANAVVTKSFPDNCVIVGNPAKILKYRGESSDES